MFLRQSTASQEVLLGPFLDDTDGKTAETALSIANTDIKVWKNGGTTESSKNSGGATHVASGRYYAVLDATDTDTVGLLELNVHVAGALPVRRAFYVLEEAVYDALFAASAAGYQVPIWSSAGATVNLSATTIKTLTDAPSDSAGITTLLSRLSASRAGYLDNLNVGGSVASQADITALNQSASRRIIITTVQQYERPESSSTGYTIEARTYDGDGAATNADSTPTMTATGSVTGSLAANLASATSPATGVYRWTYTVSSSATQEQIRFDVSATIGGSTFTLSCYAQVVDLVSSTWTTSDRTKLEALYNKLPSKSYLTGSNNSDGDVQLDEATGTPADSSGVTSLLARLGAFTGSGVNTVLGFLKAVMSKSATTPSDVGGTFSATTDSIEAIRDAGGGDATAANQTTIINHLVDIKGASFSTATDTLEKIRDALPVGSGTGAYTLTIQVTDGTSALQSATVRLVEGVNDFIAVTNASGIATFALDAATYSVAITKAGYTFTPTTKVVSGTGSQTYAMTQVTTSPDPDPAKSVVTIECYGTDTLPEAGVLLTLQQITAVTSDTGHAFDGTEWEETSDGDGLVTLTLWRNATYRIKRGSAKRWTEFTPNSAIYSITSISGAD